MAEIILDIPNGQINRLRSAIEEQRQGMIGEEELDLTGQDAVVEYLKDHVIQYCKSFVHSNERKKAKRNAAATVTNDFEVS